MSTRSSMFIEIKSGVFYGVYRHHDGYPSGAGADILEAENTEGLEGVKKLMKELARIYDAEYINWSEEEIRNMWTHSDQEYGYLRRLDGTWEAYMLLWDDKNVSTDSFFLKKVERIPGTLEEIVRNDE